MATLVLLASCGQEHPAYYGDGNISLDPTTDRATAPLSAVLDLTDIQANGFTVWATADNNTTGWMAGIAGAQHVYNSGVWSFSTPVAWPTDAAAYPVNFHAMYPAPAVITAAGSTIASTYPDLTVDFTVPATAADQFDLAGSKAVANTQPVTDQLAVTFHHLLSKIDFSFTVATDLTAYVQALGVENLANTGTYDFVAEAWTSTPSVYTARYDYYKGASASLTFATGTNLPVYAGVHSNHLMMLPQNNPFMEWDTTAVPTTENYVTLFYRMEQSANTNFLGYPQASSHPAFATDGGSTSATSPLYVKVGFSFTLDWVAGRGYVYNISLATRNGGFLLDQNFYDEAGVRTGLLFGDNDGDGTVDPAQPVPPQEVLGGDGNIHLIPTVSGWDDTNTGI